MTGTQLKDLWGQWTIHAKSTWASLIHGPFTDDAGKTASPLDYGPQRQNSTHDLRKPDARDPAVRIGE
jgi:hypothetical protein